MPAYRLRGRLVVKKSEFNQWMARRRMTARIDALVDDVLNDLGVSHDRH